MKAKELGSVITPLLERDPQITFAFIFGSHTKRTAHPRSDVDIAVYCSDIDSGRDGDARAVDKQIALGLTLEQALSRRTDVVVLNRATVDMRQNVLAHGDLLFCKDPRALADFKQTQLREYQDYLMLEPIFRRYRKRRIEEGTFGGRSDDSTQIIRYD